MESVEPQCCGLRENNKGWGKEGKAPKGGESLTLYSVTGHRETGNLL